VTNQTAVRLNHVRKLYRLYQKPAYRFLDLIGVCPSGPQYYSEHEALAPIDLVIRRGEKVAIIGRNGAGKSTLLKLITGLVQPTAGDLEVHGAISNLLQIGSGFHPDFTGRQNVFANLAHQGIVGRAAAEKFEEIVQFAEVERYIDQPMKTYSTGMCSRLMFASAVMLTPDILVVDEILGVGDAYFSHKSFERMRDLCSRDGTTLLLVTHDIYSALNLCDRFLWLDRGRLCFDGDGKAAIGLYESSIKEQEEQSLRQQRVRQLSKNAASAPKQILHVVLRSRTGFALRDTAAFDMIDLRFADGSHTALSVAHGAPGWDLVPESSLGPAETIEDRATRALRVSSSIFHKAEWLVSVPAGADLKDARVIWNYQGEDILDFRVFTTDRDLMVSGELAAGVGWQDATFERAQRAQTLDLHQQIDYGTGLVRIERVQFLVDGREVSKVKHGETLTIRTTIQRSSDLTQDVATFVLAFSRQGSAFLGIVYEPTLQVPDAPESVIDVVLDPVLLGSGTWFLNVGIGERGLYDRPILHYFATDSSWYHLLTARIELEVVSVSGLDMSGCFMVHPATVTTSAVHDHLVS
jgi:ABC-type polysaccharide/polyol phosphate transport system ATPase subunit